MIVKARKNVLGEDETDEKARQLSILDQLNERFTRQSITVDSGVWSFVQTQEQGLPLVLLPGAQGTYEIYANQLLELGKDIRIVAVTYPEISDCPALATGFKSFLDALGITQAAFSGSSFGGLWLQFFAARFPEYVAGILLANSFVSSQSKHAFFDQILAMTGPDVVAAINRGTQAAADKSSAHRQLAEIIGALVGPVQSGEGLQSRLRGARFSDPAPVMNLPPGRIALIECDNDPLVDPAMREEIASRYGRSPRHVIQGGEHYPAVLRPDEYSVILRDFHAAAVSGATARG